MANFDMISNEGHESGQSSQDKGKGKERETVNEFPTPPQPNQNRPRPQIPCRWPTPVATNDYTDYPGTSDYSGGSAHSAVSVYSNLSPRPLLPRMHANSAKHSLRTNLW